MTVSINIKSLKEKSDKIFGINEPIKHILKHFYKYIKKFKHFYKRNKYKFNLIIL